MTYTLWSHGRLLGRSSLAYARCFPHIRAGDFEPTEVGESLLPILCGMGPAVEALAEILDSHAKPVGAPPEESPGLHDCVRLTTEYADIRSIGDQLENLALELRDPKGERVPTSLIGIQDTEHLLALARRNVIPIEEEDDLEEWLPRPSRYQIIVEMEADEDMGSSGAPPWALSPK